MSKKEKIDINEMTDQELFEAVRKHMMKFNKRLAPVDDPEKLLDAFLVYAMTFSYEMMPEDSPRASTLIGFTWKKVIEATEERDSIVREKIKKILSELDFKDTDEKLH